MEHVEWLRGKVGQESQDVSTKHWTEYKQDGLLVGVRPYTDNQVIIFRPSMELLSMFSKMSTPTFPVIFSRRMHVNIVS